MACAAYSDNVVKANLHYMYITANNQGRRQKIPLNFHMKTFAHIIMIFPVQAAYRNQLGGGLAAAQLQIQLQQQVI